MELLKSRIIQLKNVVSSSLLVVIGFLIENMKLCRLLIFLVVLFASFNIFLKNTNGLNFNKKDILGILISIISIIVAIIVTYLFSKLFAEKTIKVERKKEIDIISLKITRLRKIAFHIRNMHNFWIFRNNVKSAVDGKYPHLTYEEYRSSVLQGKKLSYEEWVKIDKDIYGTSGQAYLAIKGLVDGESDYSMFGKFTPKNYSLNDVERYKEYGGSFWSLLDRSDDSIVNFNGVANYWFEKVEILFFEIQGIQINSSDRKMEIKRLFEDFESKYFPKHYYLNSLNQKYFSAFFNSLFNLLVFVVILLLCLFLFIIELTYNLEYIYSLILVSAFIANTVDLIILLITSIYSEQKIEEIFTI
tara:strand:- start:3997 stop:5073 length:1077 start_codon:yes stop_codon:yes gene_type:complete